MPITVLIVVERPIPLRPIRVTTSRAATSNDTPKSAWLGP
jgi:hypothetical protein